MMRRHWFLKEKNSPPLSVLILASVVVLIATSAACSSEKTKEPRLAHVPSASLVTKVLQPQSIPEEIEAVGTVRSKTTSVVASRLMANVVSVKINPGDTVRAGQGLMSLDSRDLAAQLSRVKAAMRAAQDAVREAEHGIAAAASHHELAQSTLTRFATLMEKKSVSAQEFEEVSARAKASAAQLDMARLRHEQARAHLEAAKAEVDNATVALSFANVTSPLEGVVVEKKVDAGTTVAPGTPLVIVEDQRSLRVEATLDESKIALVKLHQKARVEIGEGDHRATLPGQVVEIVPAADPMSRSFMVRVAIPTTKSIAVRSGMFARVYFHAGAARKVLLVPRSAIQQQGMLEGVFVIDPQNFLRWRLLRSGKSFGDQMEILSGLEAGEKVVISATTSLRDGTKVE